MHQILHRGIKIQLNASNLGSVYDKLRKYKLPDLMDLMEYPIEKHKWKKASQTTYRDLLGRSLDRRKTKSTLKFLNLQHPLFGNSHQVWKTVPKNTMEVKKSRGKSEITDRNVYA